MDNLKKILDEKCEKYDDLPNILPKVERIIVLGDIHGDFNILIEMLLVAKVINKKKQWIGGNTIVVQLGDQIDSCRFDGINDCNNKITKNDKGDDIKILKFMTILHSRATFFGGAVYSILGNHELMNVEGDMTYVSRQNIINDGGLEKRIQLFKPGNEIANFLACTRKMALIIGSNLFVHAGIVPEMVRKYNIDDMNLLLSLYLLDELKEPNNFKDLFTTSKFSPLWNRVFGNINDSIDNCQKLLTPLQQVYKVGKIFVGHTPQIEKGINSYCDNRIWLTDYGASKAFDQFDSELSQGSNKRMETRKAQVLEIIDDNIINILK